MSKEPEIPMVTMDDLSEKKEYNSKLFCPNCHGAPFITLASAEPLKLKIVCYDCMKETTKTLEELQKICEIDNGKEVDCSICPAHEDQKFEFYCKKCRNGYCKKCKEANPKHEISHQTSIIALNSFPNLDSFRTKIIEAKNYVLYGNRALENACIKRLIGRLKDEISRITSIFEKNRLINLDIIRYVEILKFNYDENNYASIENMINNTDFQYKSIDESQSNQNIINEMKSNYILEPKKNFPIFSDPSYSIQFKKKYSFSTDPILSICILKDDRLAVGTVGGKIEIINPFTDSSEITIHDHKESVNSLSMSKAGNLLSCSADKTIKLWQIKGNKYECITTFAGHLSAVSKVIGFENEDLAASCSFDKNIKIWKTKFPYTLSQTLSGHEGFVRSIIKMKNFDMIVSVSHSDKLKNGDNTLRFWDLKTNKQAAVLNGVDCCNVNALIEVSGNLILCGSLGYKVFIIDGEQKQVIKTLEYSAMADSFISLDDENVLFGNNLGTLISFNIKNYTSSLIRQAHEKAISCMISYSVNSICTGSYDKLVKVWTIKGI